MSLRIKNSVPMWTFPGLYRNGSRVPSTPERKLAQECATNFARVGNRIWYVLIGLFGAFFAYCGSSVLLSHSFFRWAAGVNILGTINLGWALILGIGVYQDLFKEAKRLELNYFLWRGPNAQYQQGSLIPCPVCASVSPCPCGPHCPVCASVSPCPCGPHAS